MSLKKLLLLLVIVALFISAFAFDLTQYLSLDVLKEKQQQLNQLFADYPFTVFAVYFVIYVVTTASGKFCSVFWCLSGFFKRPLYSA